MEPQAFWELIAGLGSDHDDVEAFRAGLSRRSGEEISAFWDLLAAYATALNTDGYRAQTPVDVGDDPDAPLPLGDDAFLDARMAVIGHGRQVYESVAADPARFGTVWPFDLGEALVTAVGDAYEESTGDPWPAMNPDVLPSSELPRLSRWRWFNVDVFDYYETYPVPPVYMAHMKYLEHLLNEDRSWWNWWDTARGEESYLSWKIDPANVTSRRTTIRSGKDPVGYDEVTVAFRVPRSEFEAPPGGSADLTWAVLARTHFDLLFTKLHAKFSLPDSPALSRDTAALEAEQLRWTEEDARRETDEAEATNAWQRHRSSEHIWRGRAPDHAVDELIVATLAGKRIVGLPQMIADLRARYRIETANDDALRLADAGYNAAEIEIALGPSDVRPDIPWLTTKKRNQGPQHPDGAQMQP